jgi:Cu(I)/Ag(I) efflux system membrane protein CusA/SilA
MLMTVGMNLVGLIPVMIAEGAGADVTQRIASPMIGGLVTLLVMTVLIVPAAYVTARSVLLRVQTRRNGGVPPATVRGPAT